MIFTAVVVPLVITFLTPHTQQSFIVNAFRTPWFHTGSRLQTTTPGRKQQSFFPATSFQNNANHPSKTTTYLSSSISTSSSQSTTSSPSSDDLNPNTSVGAWIPLASQKSLSTLSPVSLTVLGQRLVVWKSPLTEQWFTAADVCPHKSAPLSQGRVDTETGCVECPYHGWQFEGTEGRVVKVPQMDEAGRRNLELGKVSPKLNAKTYPVHAAGDLLFVFLPSSIHGEMFLNSTLPEDMFPYLKKEMDAGASYFMRELPYSWDFLVENFMDPAHIPFAHHGSQGTRNDGMPIPMAILANNHTHLEIKFDDISGGVTRDAIMSYQRPSYYHFRLRSQPSEPYTPRLIIYCVPVTAGSCRVFIKEFFPKSVPTWLQHAATNRFLNTDTWLHDTERNVRAVNDGHKDTLGYVLPTGADMSTRAFRSWWKKSGLAAAPTNTFGPSSLSQLNKHLQLNRREQIDPWNHHTQYCSSCRKALKGFKTLEKAGLFVTVGSAILLAFFNGYDTSGISRVVLSALSVLGLSANFVSKKAATFIEGNPYPSGVSDRSVSALKD